MQATGVNYTLMSHPRRCVHVMNLSEFISASALMRQGVIFVLKSLKAYYFGRTTEGKFLYHMVCDGLYIMVARGLMGGGC